jgi:transposase
VVALLAKAPQRGRRQRQDVHHTAAFTLLHENDTISYADWQTANMVTNHHLAKSIQDARASRLLAGANS